jgi:hypothetical protein
MDETTKYLVAGSAVLGIASAVYSMWVHRKMYDLTNEVADFFHISLGSGPKVSDAGGGKQGESGSSSLLDAVFG